MDGLYLSAWVIQLRGGRLPKRGESVAIDGPRFTVLRGSDARPQAPWR